MLLTYLLNYAIIISTKENTKQSHTAGGRKMSEIKTDYRGYVQHWIRSENDFTYNCMEYERDEENGRCYMLVESCNLRPEMDGALVKKRIKKSVYEKAFEECKKVFEQPE